MKKKIIQLDHKDQEIYPVTYSQAVVHNGELLCDVLDTKLQADSLKTINDESLVGSGNIEIKNDFNIFKDHIFPHSPETGTDAPVRFIGYANQPEDPAYTGENWLKIGNDHAQLSGKYTLSDGQLSSFNFNAAGFDFKRFDPYVDIKTRFSVKNDISLSARHINFLCQNREESGKDLTKNAKIIFGDNQGNQKIYSYFYVNDFKIIEDNQNQGEFVFNNDGIYTAHTSKIKFQVENSKLDLHDNNITLSQDNQRVRLNTNGIEGALKGIKYDFSGGNLRINGADRCAIFGMEHGGHTNYVMLNNDIHVGVDPTGGVNNKYDASNDVIKIKADGKMFIKGVGNFDGTNADTAQSLQEVIENTGLDDETAIVIASALNDLNDRLAAIENGN